MGEKEQAAARESSAPSVSEREAGSGMATGREAMSGQATGRESAIGEDDWEAPVSLATGDLDGNGIAIGDPGVNGNIVDDPAATAINNSHSNIKNLRMGSGGLDDDGVGTLDEGPVSVVKTKTKSNQSNDRLGREDDPAAVDDDGDGAVDEDPVSVLKNKTKSNQSNDRLGHEGVAIEGTPKTPIP
ncbi:MAG: hypothetical protein ABIQ47_10060 [Tepidiformaceae bacterium]